MNMHQPTAAEQAASVKALKQKFFGPAKIVNMANAIHSDELATKRAFELDQKDKEIEALKAAMVSKDLEIVKLQREVEEKNLAIMCQAQLMADRFGPLIQKRNVDRPHPREIITRVLGSSYPGVSYEEVTGSRKMQRIVDARHACIAAVFIERPDMSYSMIAQEFGHRDHTTVLRAIRKMGLARPSNEGRS